jgi:hypothetical protein
MPLDSQEGANQQHVAHGDDISENGAAFPEQTY